ncbi:NAD(P)H-dependent oxidoreductase subunit E [Thiohalorhabdus sp. Cl-TMA]|uniref:NADH-quinone oxidoreductase subunit E n=1 Tax=Thiohalorhabdus methylotrophus TaxID=3242694 RepID=A0ABV4TWW2_9GAMM
MSKDETGDALEIESICARHEQREGPLLAILHEVQEGHGYISNEAVGRIAHYLNLTRAEVYGVVTFYPDLREEPPRPHMLKVCRAEACQAAGGREVWATAEAMAADPDCQVEVEPVYCLGNCPCGPAVQMDERTLGRFTPEKVSALIAGASGGSSS